MTIVVHEDILKNIDNRSIVYKILYDYYNEVIGLDSAINQLNEINEKKVISKLKGG